MTSDIVLYAAIGAIVVAGFLVPVLQSRRRLAELEDRLAHLAQSFGMSLKIGSSKSGQPTEITLSAPEDGLKLVLHPSRRARKGRNTALSGRVVASLPGPRFVGGLLVAMPQVDARHGEALAVLSGSTDSELGRKLASKVVGPGMGAQLGALQDFSATAGRDVTMLSVVDPSMFFDLSTLADAVRNLPWRRGASPIPSVVFSETGLEVSSAFVPWEENGLKGMIALTRRIGATLRT